MNNNFCIVIPIYKDIDITEKLSLQQLLSVTKDKYDIYFITPNNFNLDNYYKITKDYKNIYNIEFDSKYFESSKTYSLLCISYDFYDKFSKYDYMYIYQLDCYLFKDELQKWVDKDYDYIGAPILTLAPGWFDNDKPFKPMVGNGGFSLRKISKFKEITDPYGEFRNYYNITDDFLKTIEWEDVYFCKYVYNKYEMKIPFWQEALNFSFDMNVNIIYNNLQFKGFPMCCHAWPKNIRHWKDKIPEINQEIIDFCENKYKEFFKVYYNNTNNNVK